MILFILDCHDDKRRYMDGQAKPGRLALRLTSFLMATRPCSLVLQIVSSVDRAVEAHGLMPVPLTIVVSLSVLPTRVDFEI